MCTVSFVPVGNEVIITSNRDEKSMRPPATPPQQIQTKNGALYYPVDTKAGGTWFIINEKGDAGVLLNGAFTKHLPQAQYACSRGRILPALFDFNDPIEAIKAFDFAGIENCTLVLYCNNLLYECVWDGQELFLTKLDASLPYIWSSVTLYNTAMIADRKQWFNTFIASNPTPSQQDLIQFHTNTGKGNDIYGLKMNRDNAMLTVSITSVALSEGTSLLKYTDCLLETQTIYNIDNSLIA